MPAIRCPYCGTQRVVSTREPVPGGDSSWICPACGKAVEPPAAGNAVPPPLPDSDGGNNRSYPEPPEAPANLWSPQPPWADDSSSSELVSQSPILPKDESDEPPPRVRPPAGPLVWSLLVLALFLAALIGVISLARAIRPWLDARRAAAQQSTVEFWLPQLDGSNEEARQKAAKEIVDLGPQAVCRALDHISRGSGDAVSFLFEPAAVRALAGVGADAVPALCEALGSPQPNIRAGAAEVLAQMGAIGRAARDNLLAALDDPNRWVRYSAIDALGYLGPDGGPAAKRLAEFVGGPDRVARRGAIQALGRIGPDAGDAKAALEKAAADDNPEIEVRISAALALKQLEVAQLARAARLAASGEMQQRLQDMYGDNVPAAIAAAGAVGKLGFDGQAAAPALAIMLRNPDRTERLAAATALGHIGLGAADFIPTLEAAAREDDPEVRAAAAKALKPPAKREP